MPVPVVAAVLTRFTFGVPGGQTTGAAGEMETVGLIMPTETVLVAAHAGKAPDCITETV